MIWVLIIAGTVLAAAVALVVFGLLQPVKHSVSRSIILKQKPDAIFAVVDRAEDFPSWSSMITRATRIPDRDGRMATRETIKFGMTIIATTLERTPPTHLVVQAEQEGGPVWGTWTYRLETVGDGCRVSITEEGEMRNPIFRALAELRGLDASIKIQLKDLARKFGEAPTIQ